MQIQNNFKNYSGTEYQKSYTNHGAERFYGPEEKRPEGWETTAKEGRLGQEQPAKTEAGQLLSRENNSGRKNQETGLKKGVSVIRQIWDSMGEEDNAVEKGVLSAEEGRIKGDSAGGILAAITAIRTQVSSYIIEKWEGTRDRVKEGAGAAFKRFNKRKDAFLALADPGRRSLGKKEEKHGRQGQAGRREGRTKPEILSAVVSDTHLTDSYSKTGEYCKLNDNLSYRREQRLLANRRAFSERADEGALKEPSKGTSKETSKRLDKRL